MKNTHRIMEKLEAFLELHRAEIDLFLSKARGGLKTLLSQLHILEQSFCALIHSRRSVFTAFALTIVPNNMYGVITVCHAEHSI